VDEGFVRVGFAQIGVILVEVWKQGLAGERIAAAKQNVRLAVHQQRGVQERLGEHEKGDALVGLLADSLLTGFMEEIDAAKSFEAAAIIEIDAQFLAELPREIEF